MSDEDNFDQFEMLSEEGDDDIEGCDFGFWNHRVIRHDDELETWYGIHECFYSEKDRDNENAIPHSWTSDAIGFSFYDPAEATETLDRFKKALIRQWFRVVDDKTLAIIDIEHSRTTYYPDGYKVIPPKGHEDE